MCVCPPGGLGATLGWGWRGADLGGLKVGRGMGGRGSGEHPKVLLCLDVWGPGGVTCCLVSPPARCHPLPGVTPCPKLGPVSASLDLHCPLPSPWQNHSRPPGTPPPSTPAPGSSCAQMWHRSPNPAVHRGGGHKPPGSSCAQQCHRSLGSSCAQM